MYGSYNATFKGEGSISIRRKYPMATKKKAKKPAKKKKK